MSVSKVSVLVPASRADYAFCATRIKNAFRDEKGNNGYCITTRRLIPWRLLKENP